MLAPNLHVSLLAALAAIVIVIGRDAAIAADACSIRHGLSRQGNLDLRLPFEVVDGRIYVQAHVNGTGPHRFMVDTGASGIGRADVRLVRKLALPLVGRTENSDGVNISSVDVVLLESLALGGLERRNVEVSSRDYNRRARLETTIAGIIGREFFEDGLLILDYPSRTLSYDDAYHLSAEASDVLRYDTPFHVPIKIGNTRAEGSIDTGSNLTMHLPRSLYDRIATDGLEPAGLAYRANTTFQLYRARLRDPVQIGAARLTDLTVMVSDSVPLTNVGGGVLQNFAHMIDQRERLLALCSPAHE